MGKLLEHPTASRPVAPEPFRTPYMIIEEPKTVFEVHKPDTVRTVSLGKLESLEEALHFMSTEADCVLTAVRAYVRDKGDAYFFDHPEEERLLRETAERVRALLTMGYAALHEAED